MSGQELHILVAEVDVTIQSQLVKLLSRANYRVDVVDNGNDALDELNRNDFDAAILNINIPGQVGLEEIRRHRGQSKGSRTPLIVVTAGASPVAISKWNALSAAAYVPEPIRSQQLLDVVGSVVGRVPVNPPGLAAALGEPTDRIQKKSAVDFARLGRLYDEHGDDEFIEGLVRKFLSEASGLLQEIKQATDAGELATVQELAHRARGSAATLGALRMEEASESLYRRCETARDRTELVPLVEDLDLGLQQTKEEFEEHLSRTQIGAE